MTILKTDFLKMEIARHPWAIVPESLQAIMDFVETGADLDANLFHAEQEKPRAQFGTEVAGSLYSYRNGPLGVLVIDGPITPRATMFSDVSGIMSIDVMTAELKAFQSDPRIQSIALVMDTPGGAITGVSDFADLVAKSEKPVSVFAWEAASAGYWIAAAASEIVAPVSGMVGSIGVVVGYTDTTAADEKSGKKRVEIVSSQSPNKRPDMQTDSGRATVQQLLDDLAGGFIDSVAAGRGVTAAEVEERFGAGAMFAAPRALEAGMIDRIMSFDEFIKTKSAARPGGLNGGFKMEEEKRDIAGAERDRIRSIEALAEKFAGSHPAVIGAVRAAIDGYKFEADQTPESVAVALLEVVAKANNEQLEALAKSHATVNAVAAEASKAGEADDSAMIEQKESKARAEGLAAQFKGGNK